MTKTFRTIQDVLNEKRLAEIRQMARWDREAEKAAQNAKRIADKALLKREG